MGARFAQLLGRKLDALEKQPGVFRALAHAALAPDTSTGVLADDTRGTRDEGIAAFTSAVRDATNAPADPEALGRILYGVHLLFVLASTQRASRKKDDPLRAVVTELAPLLDLAVMASASPIFAHALRRVDALARSLLENPVPNLVFLLLVHSVLGWGGTNAFNSAEDRDEGPVNMLPSPPPRPAHLGAFGIAWGLLAILVTIAWPGQVRVVPFVILAALLSLAYSYRGGPFRRLKEIGIVDNVTNALGCGPIAIGWGVAAPFDCRLVPIAAGFLLAFFGGYTTTQIFQLREDDTYATARNYTSLFGAPLALRLSALALLAHLVALLAVVRERALGSIAYSAWVLLVLVAALHAWRWARLPRDVP